MTGNDTVCFAENKENDMNTVESSSRMLLNLYQAWAKVELREVLFGLRSCVHINYFALDNTG